MTISNEQNEAPDLLPAVVDTTPQCAVGNVTDTTQTVAYGGEAVEAPSEAVAIQRCSSPLILKLHWADIHCSIMPDNTIHCSIMPDTPLASLDLRLQERAGVYWESLDREQLQQEFGALGPLHIRAEIQNDSCEMVLPSLPFEPLGEVGYSAIWDGRGANGRFVDPGRYRVKLTVSMGLYWDESVTGDLDVPKGNAYAVSIVVRPKDDDDMRKAMDLAGDGKVGISVHGRKILRDSLVEVWHGGLPGSSDAVLVGGPFEAHAEATCPGYFSTPKLVNFDGFYRFHDKDTSDYSAVGFGKMVGKDDWRVKLSMVQPNTPGQTNPQPYKNGIMIHMESRPWTDLNSSQGCILIPGDPRDPQRYGVGRFENGKITTPFGELRNRQNVKNPGDDYIAANNFLACVYGGFRPREIQNPKITVRLTAANPGSVYDQLQRAPVAFYSWTFGWEPVRGQYLIFYYKVNKAMTVLRRVVDGAGGSEDLLVHLSRDSTGPVTRWVPLLRYRSDTLTLDHTLSPEEYEESFIPKHRLYCLAIKMASLPLDLQKAARAGGLVHVVFKVRYAWDWVGLDRPWYIYTPQKTLNFKAITGNYPYLPTPTAIPPGAASSYRWDPVEWEFEVPDAIPSQTGLSQDTDF